MEIMARPFVPCSRLDSEQVLSKSRPFSWMGICAPNLSWNTIEEPSGDCAVWYAGCISGERLRRGYISPANGAHSFRVSKFCPSFRGWRRELPYLSGYLAALHQLPRRVRRAMIRLLRMVVQGGQNYQAAEAQIVSQPFGVPAYA
jgi:hypothetical protein